VSSDGDVRRTMGQPALEFTNPDGSRQLAYPRGPLGTQTFMVHLGKDGLVQGVEQVLDEDHFPRVKAGRTREELLRLIGPPGETMDFPRQQQVAWDYRFMDAWSYTAILSVMLDGHGTVTGKFTRRIEPRERSH